MKKYISIFSVITVLIFQSCDDAHRDANMQDEGINQSSQIGKKSANAMDVKNQKSGQEDENANRDTGDDEPRRDKQHWRTANDSVAKVNIKL